MEVIGDGMITDRRELVDPILNMFGPISVKPSTRVTTSIEEQKENALFPKKFKKVMSNFINILRKDIICGNWYFRVTDRSNSGRDDHFNKICRLQVHVEHIRSDSGQTIH